MGETAWVYTLVETWQRYYMVSNGLEAVEKLHTDIPIVALSAHVLRDDKKILTRSEKQTNQVALCAKFAACKLPLFVKYFHAAISNTDKAAKVMPP